MYKNGGWQGKPPSAYWNLISAYFQKWSGATVCKTKPVKLTIDSTNICQLLCPFCPTGQRQHDRQSGRADIVLIDKIIDDFGRDLFFIDFFNWGEPLLNRAVLFEWIRKAHTKSIWTTISTNFSIPFTKQDCDQLVLSGLNEMVISLDGINADTYSHYRRGGQFDLVLKNIGMIAEAKKRLGRKNPWLVWQMLVFGFNEGDTGSAQQKFAELGFDELRLSPPYIHNNSEDSIQWEPKSKEYRSNSHFTRKTKKRAKKNSCDWLYFSAAINWDGAISPCCSLFKKKDDFGSIGTRGSVPFMNIYNNDIYTHARAFSAGISSTPKGICCEKCPSPNLKNYSKTFIRSIFLLLLIDFFKFLSFKKKNIGK